MNVSRRNLLTGTAALALAAPAVAVANDAPAHHFTPDPVLDAVREWVKAREAVDAAEAAFPEDATAARYEDEVMEPAYEAATDAAERVGDTVATTPRGLTAKMAVAAWEYRMMHLVMSGTDYDVRIMLRAAQDAVSMAGYDLGETEDDAMKAIRRIVGGAA